MVSEGTVVAYVRDHQGGASALVARPALSRCDPDACRELQVSEQTYYRWRNQFGGLKADDAKRLKDLERENSTLKRLLAEAELEKAALKEIARGNF
jgi:transposase-like protein